jgi:hypothetical protein
MAIVGQGKGCMYVETTILKQTILTWRFSVSLLRSALSSRDHCY